METKEQKESMEENSGNVRVLSRSEKVLYDGITIEGGVDPDAKIYHTSDYMNNFRIKNFTFQSDSILTKIVLGLVITGAIFFILFVALPIVLVVLGVLLTIWLLLSFFQKR